MAFVLQAVLFTEFSLDEKPRIYAKIPCTLGDASFSQLISVGDVNHDGYGDVGAVYTDPDQLILFLGESSSTGLAYNQIDSTSINFENPCSNLRFLSVYYTVDARRTIKRSLYSLKGDLVKVYPERIVSRGTSAENLDISGLAPSIYNLRFEVDGRSIDKGLILVK